MDGRQRNSIDALLWHHSCHMVDIAMSVLGVDHAEIVSAMLGESAHSKFGMAMDMSIHFRAGVNQLVTHALTYNAEQLVCEVRFIGLEDMLTYCNGQLHNERNERSVPEARWVDFVSQDEEMLAAIGEGAPSDYDVRSVLPAMRVLHSAQHSAGAKVKGGRTHEQL